MKGAGRYGLVALVAFAAALAAVLVARIWIAPEPRVESEVHALIHQKLKLDDEQERRIHALEMDFARRRAAMEAEMRADNARLAQAIAAEHGYGPKVSEAVDRTHHVMGMLQKETLKHIFAMRAVLRPDQAAQFDAAVVKVLTEPAR
ncbi:Heavy metal resistance protein [Sphingobium herbicidovorans NBRC 16415]|uniref:Heavy metal resistance protein n=1 Tax=Sphingobium herbicidovorans (strain ATCC 700291 / DSM 11019 / CCUG 56400 / KCTC 2939 / LMG 18315 / NBRC 16415 / MH) TaxID=1219045 RepID=A0A086PFE0_SPHHM|nr:periplasmic heavy metal sensor [Sphingobium herbicidovorans]KFG92108.1 Heavy metal resistance protein [Sphingobium herbicidovorans NBRC 16415]